MLINKVENILPYHQANDYLSFPFFYLVFFKIAKKCLKREKKQVLMIFGGKNFGQNFL